MQQCIQLTGTNQPWGLTTLFFLGRTKVGLIKNKYIMASRVFEINNIMTKFPFSQFSLVFDPVSIAKWPHPFPSRTRKLSISAAMVLHLRVRESSSVPGLIFLKGRFEKNLPFFYAKSALGKLNMLSVWYDVQNTWHVSLHYLLTFIGTTVEIPRERLSWILVSRLIKLWNE